MVSLPPVGRLVTIRDKSDESGVVRELQVPDRVGTGGAAVGVQVEEQRRKYTALGGTSWALSRRRLWLEIQSLCGCVQAALVISF